MTDDRRRMTLLRLQASQGRQRSAVGEYLCRRTAHICRHVEIRAGGHRMPLMAPADVTPRGIATADVCSPKAFFGRTANKHTIFQ